MKSTNFKISLFIGLVFVLALFWFILKTEKEKYVDYDLPKIVYCGHDKEIRPDRLSRISRLEEGMCDILQGQSFETLEEAKKEYGTKIDFTQVSNTEGPLSTRFFTAFPEDKIKFDDNEIEIRSANAEVVEFKSGDNVQSIAVGDSYNFGNFDIKLDYACGETYQVDFEVLEYACCLKEANDFFSFFVKPCQAADSEFVEEEEDEMVKKAKEQSEEDLKESGRSGYKGVILPNTVAKDYPSWDFTILPFIAEPNEMCCGCRQDYENLQWWAELFKDEVASTIGNKIAERNKQKSEFEEDPYTLVERDEGIMRNVLRELNYVKQNIDYFNKDTVVPKGEWINPDYVIEGGINFSCCEGSKYLRVEFVVDFINAKTEKRIERVVFSPATCFDLMQQPGHLKSVVKDYAAKVADSWANIFIKK